MSSDEPLNSSDHTIDLGTLTDEYEKEISIHTTSTNKDGEKTILAGKEVTIDGNKEYQGKNEKELYPYVGLPYTKYFGKHSCCGF